MLTKEQAVHAVRQDDSLTSAERGQLLGWTAQLTAGIPELCAGDNVQLIIAFLLEARRVENIRSGHGAALPAEPASADVAEAAPDLQLAPLPALDPPAALLTAAQLPVALPPDTQMPAPKPQLLLATLQLPMLLPITALRTLQPFATKLPVPQRSSWPQPMPQPMPQLLVARAPHLGPVRAPMKSERYVYPTRQYGSAHRKSFKHFEGYNAPTRPSGPYIFFCLENCVKLKRDGVVVGGPAVGAANGAAWRAQSDAERALYNALADRDFARYEAETAVCFAKQSADWHALAQEALARKARAQQALEGTGEN